MRDVANPRFVELARRPRVDPARLNVRGAVFTLEPGENFGPIAAPPLPPEAGSHVRDIRLQTQRALLPDAIFGGVQGQVSSLVMSQVVAVASQVIDPFHEALQGLIGQVCTFNIHQSLIYQELFGIDMGIPGMGRGFFYLDEVRHHYPRRLRAEGLYGQDPQPQLPDVHDFYL